MHHRVDKHRWIETLEGLGAGARHLSKFKKFHFLLFQEKRKRLGKLYKYNLISFHQLYFNINYKNTYSMKGKIALT
ncbi:hypothetical protein BKP35_00040 [Anaerobacillus arseniciselenatis]|uniref:Uncharacterized protein n=1 Tax=Anaerobacillus arseniciselenatis TaxID=85682 RepID=A0A1S2LTG2_9BACI|nr:hypothetical protein BKP35_00040 [Anaerobacillus arseniciselenatis]